MSHSAIELHDVSLQRDQKWLLRDVNWKLRSGMDAAILGPNGSGKSTLARILTGYLWPTNGTIQILGERFGEVDLSWLRKKIKLVQPNGEFEVDPRLTVLEAVLTGIDSTLVLRIDASSAQIELAKYLLDVTGIGYLAKRNFGVASSGERARTLIARALITTPHLLLLDEPTAGLDLLGREQLMNLIATLRPRLQSPELTILTITHHTEELIRSTAEVLLLDRGKVVASGPIDQVLTSELLSRVYNIPIAVHRDHDRYYCHVQ